jgi:hypothetical protein
MENFLNSTVKKLADINEWETLNITTLKSLFKREELRRDFRYIQQQLKGLNGSGLSSHKTQNDESPGKWETIARKLN